MIKIAIKDLKLFLSDRRALILTFIVPIALISLFSLAFGRQSTSGPRPARLVIADEDKTDQSKGIIAKLDSAEEFSVTVIPLEEAESLVKKGDESSVLVLHKGLKDSLDAGSQAPIEFKYDEAKSAEVGILKGALIGKLIGIVSVKSMEKKALRDFNSQNPQLDSASRKRIAGEISKNFSSGGTEDMQNTLLKSTPLVAESETSPGLVQAVSGTAIMMLLFSVVGMGASLLDEKQEGTLKKLLYSPLSPNSILFGKMLSSNIVSISQLTVMFLFAWVAFGLDITMNIPSLILMIIATAFACSSFGVFLASFAKSRQQVQGLSTLIILVMSAVGGSMIPFFLMPLWMQKTAVVSVNYWGIQGFYDIFWRKLSIGDPTFLTRIFVLFMIGFVLNFIATRLFKKNAFNIT
ncbi:MAG TPA: ABC transporter permease [Cyclobacteriaceae bacterium]|jgi:ABC-type Na+ efflux pump permease subunit|nr:ABC transporter permease [Cyclobacteriaceae bacterium]